MDAATKTSQSVETDRLDCRRSRPGPRGDGLRGCPLWLEAVRPSAPRAEGRSRVADTGSDIRADPLNVELIRPADNLKRAMMKARCYPADLSPVDGGEKRTPGRDRRGGRIVKRTFVQTLGPEQNGNVFPFSEEAAGHRSVRRYGVVV